MDIGNLGSIFTPKNKSRSAQPTNDAGLQLGDYDEPAPAQPQPQQQQQQQQQEQPHDRSATSKVSETVKEGAEKVAEATVGKKD